MTHNEGCTMYASLDLNISWTWPAELIHNKGCTMYASIVLNGSEEMIHGKSCTLYTYIDLYLEHQLAGSNNY